MVVALVVVVWWWTKEVNMAVLELVVKASPSNDLPENVVVLLQSPPEDIPPPRCRCQRDAFCFL